MANLTRANLRDELKKRGWSRFLDTDLDRYLDWALQDMYGKAGFDRASKQIATVASISESFITFVDIAGSDGAIRSVDRLFVQYGNDTFPVEAAESELFFGTMWPNAMASTPDTANYPSHYYVYDNQVWLWQKPSSSLTFFVHYELREDTFANDGDTSGLPERFDKAILMLAEIHCCRRAKEFEEMAVAMNAFQEFLNEELGMEGSQMTEEQERVMPWSIT